MLVFSLAGKSILVTGGSKGIGRGIAAVFGYAAAFLASDEASFITGQALVVDGGQVLPESLQAMG